jgi:Pin2-interacting protein X1
MGRWYVCFFVALNDYGVLSVTATIDAARFGSNYLSRFGWDSSKGLGAGGDGRTSHIKVSQKLDVMGIGAGAHQNDPNGIAWKQNRDFESLLKRLNEAEESGTAVDGFVKEEGKKKKKKKEKRKREEDDEGKCKKPRKNEESAEEKPVRVVPRHRSYVSLACVLLAC